MTLISRYNMSRPLPGHATSAICQWYTILNTIFKDILKISFEPYIKGVVLVSDAKYKNVLIFDLCLFSHLIYACNSNDKGFAVSTEWYLEARKGMLNDYKPLKALGSFVCTETGAKVGAFIDL